MKRILTAFILVAAVSAPAFARTTPYDRLGTMSSATRTARAQSFERFDSRALGLAGTDVFVNGQYAGRDPDPSVRFELSREFGTNR